MIHAPRIGHLKSGPRDNLCDVAGLSVGHCTLDAGEIQTGVTMVRPHPGDSFLHKVPAAAVVLNGFGKSIGLVQVDELGVLETPIALTSTFAVGTVAQAQIQQACRVHPELGRTLGTLNPLVFECNDGYLNDLQAMALAPCHVEAALADAAPDFTQGSVGAGRGMSMFGVKGGIGSASRRVPTGGQTWTLGVLVLANFGRTPNLILAGRPMGAPLMARMAQQAESRESGSIILVLATDAPLSDRQLRRLALRAGAGLARTGSFFGHGSGDIALAFSTACTVPHHPEAGMPMVQHLHETHLDPLFQAAAEGVEQAILHALFRATPVKGFRGHERPSFLELLPDWREVAGFPEGGPR